MGIGAQSIAWLPSMLSHHASGHITPERRRRGILGRRALARLLRHCGVVAAQVLLDVRGSRPHGEVQDAVALGIRSLAAIDSSSSIKRLTQAKHPSEAAAKSLYFGMCAFLFTLWPPGRLHAGFTVGDAELELV